jgi:hypothetical protein
VLSRCAGVLGYSVLKAGFALDWVKGFIPLYRNSDNNSEKRYIDLLYNKIKEQT